MFKFSKLVTLIAVLFVSVVPFVGSSVALAETSNTVSDNNQVLSDQDLEKAIEASLIFSYDTNTFYVDTVVASSMGLTLENISNLQEFAAMLSQDESKIQQMYDYRNQTQTRALPVALVWALKAIGGGALTAVSKAVTTWGMKGACGRIGANYAPFRDFCRANGWPINNGGGSRPFSLAIN